MYTLKLFSSSTAKDPPELYVTALCSNDPVMYQACNILGSNAQVKTRNRNMICGNYICKNAWDTYEITPYQGNCSTPSFCSDIECQKDNFFPCRLVDFNSISSGVPKSNVCDGKCQCLLCEDEENCYGLRFSDSDYELLRHQNSALNNSHVFCDPYEFRLYAYPEDYVLKLTNTSRCFLWIRCKNKYDQTNCTDPLPTPLSCQIDGKPSNVSTNIICKRILYSPFDKIVADKSGVCDDGIDTQCVDLSPICYIHKHLLCDGQKDCTDGADEQNSFCGQVTMETCKRRYLRLESRIPLSWIGDGVLDCQEGEDEDKKKWLMCRYDSFTVSGSSDCNDVYLCKDNQHKFVQLNNLCDKQFHCDNLNQICSPIYRDGFIHQHLYQSDNLYYLNYCLPGLNQLEVLKQKCDLISYPPAEVWLSQRNRLFVPSGKQSCANMFGENYVFMSCSGLCFDATCPLRPIARTDVCDEQKYSQIYSISRDGALTLIHKKRNIYQVTNFFECRNKICLSLDKVCNLVDNCGDGSDEKSCVNSYTCNRNNRIYDINYIPLSSVCDGQIDCADASDETDCCSKRIFQNTALRISSLFIGILAVILNSFTFVKLVNSIRKVSITSAFLDKILIIVISCGDWLLGMYLVAIAIIDIFVTKWRCEDHYEWLVSKECAWLGILSTIGSQISLFSMTALSLTRVHKIQGIQVSRNTNKRFVAKTGLLVLAIIAISVLIAVLPLTPHQEDIFINDLYYPKVRFLRGFISKPSLQRKFELFFGRFRKPISELSWQNVRQLITKMFTSNYGGITVKVHHFYGNDAVCLFKYFVSADDPQALFSWTILSINFFCFMLITSSYVAVGVKSQRSTLKLGNSATSIKARNETLQRKVSVIIATDFLCWVPFIVISLLNTTGIIDATKWYALFSTIILPLNSVINPFLYHNMLDCFVLPFKKFRKCRKDS